MKRTRAYRRDVRNRAIARKKRISEKYWGIKWFKYDGAYSKGHIGCSCWMCKYMKHFKIPHMYELRDMDHVTQSLNDYYESVI